MTKTVVISAQGGIWGNTGIEKSLLICHSRAGGNPGVYTFLTLKTYGNITTIVSSKDAWVAELVDARDLKSLGP